MTSNRARRVQLFKTRVEKLMNEGRDYSTQPILGLDAIVGQSGFYEVNERELVVVSDIFFRFIAFEGNLDRLLAYCRRRHYLTKSQTYSGFTKKSGGKKFTRSYLWKLLTNTKLFGYCMVTDHDDVFPDHQWEGKLLKFPLAHGCVIDRDLARNVRAVLLEQFKLTI
jgi:hypothetical protein